MKLKIEKKNKITQVTINKNTQATCNALVESQLPAIIDGLVNSYKKKTFIFSYDSLGGVQIIKMEI